MENHRTTPWASILLLLLSSFSSMVCFGAGLTTGLSSAMEFASGNTEIAKSSLMLSAGMFFLGMVFLPAMYYSFMRIVNKPARNFPMPKIPLAVLIAVWIVSIGLGVLLEKYESLFLLQIPLNLLTLVLPVWFLARIALRGLETGSPEHRWGTITVGMTIVPFFIGVAELMIIAFIGLAGVVWVSQSPSLVRNIESLSARLMYTANPDAFLRMLIPYIFNPAIIIMCLIFFSILTPLIEELVKPLRVWLGPNQIITPRQGFAIGALCGAAYTLVESLGALSSNSSSWGLLSMARAGSDLLHILNTGLMGWALVGAWQERKYFQLGLAYLVVILLHGIWNALSLSSAAGMAAAYLPNPSPWLKSLTAISVIGLFILVLLNLAILIHANRTLQASSPSETEATGVEQIGRL